MKKKIAICTIVITTMMFLTGLVFIFTAYSNGLTLANNTRHENGGIIEMAEYDRIITSTTTSYQMGGFVLSMVGGFGTLVSGNILLYQINHKPNER